MNSLLLSAGFGRRFSPHTDRVAKPVIPFLNIPLIYYSIYYALKFNAKKIFINTHHLPETIHTCVRNLEPLLQDRIQFIHESPTILDSGGGIKNAQSHLEEAPYFLIFNTDIPHIIPHFNFESVLENHLKKGALATFVTCDLPGLGSKISGVWTAPNDTQVKDFGLGPKPDLRCRHYTGVLILSKEIFKYQPSKQPHNIIFDVILPALKEHKELVNCHHLDSFRWFETGNLESYLEATAKTTYDLIHTPESETACELKNIFDFFKQEVVTYSDKQRDIVCTEEDFLKNLSSYQGNVVSASVPVGKKGQKIENSVIGPKVLSLESPLISNQLIL